MDMRVFVRYDSERGGLVSRQHSRTDAWMAALAVLCSLGLLAGAASAMPQTAPSPKSEMAEIYARIDRAVNNKNVDLYLSMYSPKAIVKQEDGTQMDFAGFAGNVRQLASLTGQLRQKTTVAEVLVANDGRLWAATQETLNLNMNLSPEVSAKIGASQVPVVSKAAGLDVWERSPQGWLIVQSNVLMTETKVEPEFQQKLTAKAAAAGAGAHTFAQAMQYAQQMQCQTRMIQAMGWQRLGFMAVMPSC